MQCLCYVLCVLVLPKPTKQGCWFSDVAAHVLANPSSSASRVTLLQPQTYQHDYNASLLSILTYVQALLAIILQLCTAQQSTAAAAAVDPDDQQQQQQLDAFLQAQPVATSIPFISWLAELEAKATGELTLVSHESTLTIMWHRSHVGMVSLM